MDLVTHLSDHLRPPPPYFDLKVYMYHDPFGCTAISFWRDLNFPGPPFFRLLQDRTHARPSLLWANFVVPAP